MTTSGLCYRAEAKKIPHRDLAAWRQDLLTRLETGERLVSLFGRREDDSALLTAVLLGLEGDLALSRTTAPLARGYHELTSIRPEFHCFERELHEQTGLAMPGHPWLKPLRFEQRGATMSEYPFYRIDGKEVHEVAVGPIHAGVIEPGSFRFECHGEQVHHLEIHLGYQHRAVEQLLLERDPLQLTPLVETIAGDTSVGHAWAYCAAVEALTDCKLDDEVEFARALMLELERVAMHLAALSGLAADIAFLQGATTYGRLRTTAINASMRLCGSRFGRSALRPGGVRLRPPESTLEGLFESLKLLQRDLEPMRDLFLSARTVQHRLKGVGVLSAQRAQELGMVGLAARASDVAIDTRSAPRGGAYQLEPLAPVVHPDGDCWARACVRIGELEASLDWLERVIRRHAKWDQPRRAPGRLAPNQLAVTLIEGFRGEVMHCVETNDQGRLLHYKVQDPSLRNWMGLALAVRGNEISDFPICNKSFDLSYCGHDL